MGKDSGSDTSLSPRSRRVTLARRTLQALRNSATIRLHTAQLDVVNLRSFILPHTTTTSTCSSVLATLYHHDSSHIPKAYITRTTAKVISQP